MTTLICDHCRQPFEARQLRLRVTEHEQDKYAPQAEYDLHLDCAPLFLGGLFRIDEPQGMGDHDLRDLDLPF